MRKFPLIHDAAPFSALRWATLLVVIALMRFALLGAYPLIETTEARYGEIPREMLVTGNWVTPQLDPGVPFDAKPPLSFWMSAISMKLLGVNAFAVRLPSFLMASAMVGLVFLLARRLFSERIAWFSTIILVSTGLFHFLAGGVMTDPALAASVTLSLVAFPLASVATARGKRLAWGYLFFVGLGLSMLSKGPIGVVLTLFPLALWTLWTRQLGLVWRSLPWISGTLLAAAICVPWYYLAEQRTPGFLWYFLVGEHVLRFIDAGWKGDKYGVAHEHMLGTIWVFLAGAALPWGVLFIGALAWLRRRGDTLRMALGQSWIVYLAAWTLAAPLFFSIARNIMITYILPALPALAILIAMALERVGKRLGTESAPWFLRPRVQTFCIVFAPLLMLAAGVIVLPEVAERKSQKELAHLFEENNTDGKGNLVFFDEMSNSADFYSEGSATELEERESAGDLEVKLNDSSEDFYAIEKGDLKKFKRLASHQTQEIGKRGEYTLFKEIPHVPPIG